MYIYASVEENITDKGNFYESYLKQLLEIGTADGEN